MEPWDILAKMLTPGEMRGGTGGGKGVIATLWVLALIFAGGAWMTHTSQDMYGYNLTTSICVLVVAYLGTCVISRAWK